MGYVFDDDNTRMNFFFIRPLPLCLIDQKSSVQEGYTSSTVTSQTIRTTKLLISSQTRGFGSITQIECKSRFLFIVCNYPSMSLFVSNVRSSLAEWVDGSKSFIVACYVIRELQKERSRNTNLCNPSSALLGSWSLLILCPIIIIYVFV